GAVQGRLGTVDGADGPAGHVREDPSPGRRRRSAADDGQHLARLVERVGEGERYTLEHPGVEVDGSGRGGEAEDGAAQRFVADGESFPSEGGQGEQARRPATVRAGALCEEGVGLDGGGAAEVGLAGPGGGRAG